MRRWFATKLTVAATAVLCPTLLWGASAGAALAPSSAAGPRVVDSAGIWGNAVAVGVSGGSDAEIRSVSCASAGNCSGAGYYDDGQAREQAFVVSQVDGVWGPASQVPGSATLNQGSAMILSVSCASAGNCSAGGFYTDRYGHRQAFVVRQAGGAWGMAREVSGSGALNKGGYAELSSVSCRSAGSCSAGGFYTGRSKHWQAFVVDEKNGLWGSAKPALGLAALNPGGDAEINSMSCSSVGNCGAGGGYWGGSHPGQAFVVNETGGVWGRAKKIAGLAKLNTGGSAQVVSISCAAAGSCTVGGYYLSGSHTEAFVVSQVKRIWGTAREVPGSAILNKGGYAQVYSVSCASRGNCSAGGSYWDRSGHQQAFIASQVNGKWGSAREVPGSAALNTNGSAVVTSVSCATAGNCSAGGTYAVHSGWQAFVVSQVNGRWGNAEPVTGSQALSNGGPTAIYSVSCASASACSAGGYYVKSLSSGQAMVVSKS